MAIGDNNMILSESSDLCQIHPIDTLHFACQSNETLDIQLASGCLRSFRLLHFFLIMVTLIVRQLLLIAVVFHCIDVVVVRL
jgi:hypothetical protein